MKFARKASVGAALAAGLLFAGAATPANAQVIQDGLVNVNVGDVTILEDVRIALAAQVVAEICGVKVGPVAVLGRAVDRSGTTTTVCVSNLEPVTISQ
jgi:hypothetical protein